MIEDKMKMKFHSKDSLEAEILHGCPQALRKTGAEARPSAAADKVYTWAVSHGVSPAWFKNEVSRSGTTREQD